MEVQGETEESKRELTTGGRGRGRGSETRRVRGRGRGRRRGRGRGPRGRVGKQEKSTGIQRKR